MRGFLFCLLFTLIYSVPAFSQNEITGTVKSYAGENLPGVVVKLMNGKKISGYGRTNNNGEFKIKISGESPDTLEIVAASIGFEELREKILRDITHVDLIMHESSKTLREVTIEAPKIRQRGDTMRYRLNAFTGKSDQTLEDGLKRLPGVEVGETGKVSYQGKEISDFYVENLQLVGENYGLVTKNMPAEYVTDVEFIENHQAAKMDKGRRSDDIALNIKLSNKAKFKPVGKADAMVGLQKDRLLYRVNGTGMMFSPKFQTMLTLKAGNYGNDYMFSPSIVIYGQNLPNYATSAIGKLTGATPPLSKDVYSYNNDLSGTLNFIRAFTPEKTLRINLGYTNERSSNYYSQKSIYNNEDEKIEFSENGNPYSISHLPYLNVNYTLNDPNKYIQNNFSSKLDITTNDFNLMSNDRDYYQRQRLRTLTLSDNFSWKKRFNEKTYLVTTSLSYLITPTAKISIISPGYLQAQQNASSHTFKWSASTAFDWKRGNSIWNLPLGVEFLSSRLKTDLNINPSFINNIASTQAYISVSPKYEFSPRNRKVEFLFSIPITFQFFHAHNRISESRADIDRILLNPMIKLIVNPNSRLSINFNSSITHSTGDILDLLTNEIMTDFRNIKTSSGIIGKTRNANINLKLAYKNSVDLCFADASVNYSRVNRNTINSLYIEGEEIEQSKIFFDNHSDNFGGSAMIAKHFYDQGLNLSIRGNFNWAKNHSYQQDNLITSYSTTYSIHPKIIINPLKFFEIFYTASIGKTFTKFGNSRTGIFSMSNDIKLSIYPALGWDVFGETSILRKELSDGSYKDFALFNAGVTWKFKKYRLSLRADNLLNTRHYSYSIFNGINIYNYDFVLTGRSIYLKFTATL